MKLSICQIDAFTDRLFGGNPAAIIPLEEWLPDRLLQDIAMENQLSETAYLVPEGEGWRLRWFTPTTEVDLCGHATLASAHFLFAEQGHAGDEILFHSRSGDLSVRRTGEGYSMDFPDDPTTPVEEETERFALEEALLAPIREVRRGRHDYLAVLGSEGEIRSLRPDLRRVAELDARGVIVTAPGGETDFVSRCFFPATGIDEDPVTGSAHTTMAPWWSEQVGRNRLTAAQLSRRGGLVTCEVKGDRVILGGKAVTFLHGTIEVDLPG